MNVIDYRPSVATMFADKTARRLEKSNVVLRSNDCIKYLVNHGTVQPGKDYWSTALQRGAITAQKSLAHRDQWRLNRLHALVDLDFGFPARVRHQQARPRKRRRSGKRSAVVFGEAAKLAFGNDFFATSAMLEKIARTFSKRGRHSR
ncbi:hypothetical protein [Thioclava sp.]|uniref:hypothetical protein n=1 Tax=Thioclava sp. TaxID=1933450 RepID=UPI003242ECA2